MNTPTPPAPPLDRPPRWRAWVVVGVVTAPLVSAVALTALDNRSSARVEAERQARLRSAVRALDERADQQRADMGRRDRIAELEAAKLAGPLTDEDADDLRRMLAVDDGGPTTRQGGGP